MRARRGFTWQSHWKGTPSKPPEAPPSPPASPRRDSIASPSKDTPIGPKVTPACPQRDTQLNPRSPQHIHKRTPQLCQRSPQQVHRKAPSNPSGKPEAPEGGYAVTTTVHQGCLIQTSKSPMQRPPAI